MNVLFLSFGFPDIDSHYMYPDLLRQFISDNHMIYVLSFSEKITNSKIQNTSKDGYHKIEVKSGRMQKNNIIAKGINILLIGHNSRKAIKKYLGNIKFDIVLYHTPPITFIEAIKYVKHRDAAKTYLMLKDIFPQNAVDIGMLSKGGLKGIIYKYFRRKEKKLYAISDRIGCMSQANVDYLLKHNPEISPEKVEMFPNSIEVRDLGLTDAEKIEMRRKYMLPCDKKIFVYGGNLGKPQGIPFLMDCLSAERDNSNVFFLIAGDGTEYAKLETFINKNTFPNVCLLKRLPKEDYERLVAACDVGMIFLDHRFTIPNFPSRLLSYMQAKLPVLACTDPNTDVGKVIVDGGFGWWCESNDSAKFSELINQIENTDFQKLGLKGYEYLRRNYSVEIAYEKIAQYFHNIH